MSDKDDDRSSADDNQKEEGNIISQTITIGGIKGHEIEEIDNDGLLLCVYRKFRWKMIPNCTGRYTCRDHHRVVSKLSPLELLQECCPDVVPQQKQYVFPGGRNNKDPIEILPLDESNTTGIITYIKKVEEEQQQKKDELSLFSGTGMTSSSGTNSTTTTTKKYYVHTLNTKSGFRRKLSAMGIYVDEQHIE